MVPTMSLIARRTFLLGAAAAALGACAPRSLTSGSLAQRRHAGSFVRAGEDRTGRPLHVFGGLRIDAKVTPEDTGGDLFVVEHTDEARGGPPRHVHHAQDEWSYVLEGNYRIDVGEERFDLVPGDAILAPRGVPHVWAHVGEGEGRLLIAFQPAGQMASFLNALAALGSAPAPEVMAALFASHGMTMLGPPLPF